MTVDDYKRIAKELEDDVIASQPARVKLPPRERVLEIARLLVASGKVYEPTRRNDGVPRFLFCDGEWMPDLNRGHAWCAAFVLYCHRSALYTIPGNRFELRSVEKLYEKARDLGVLLPRTTIPEPGDVIFFADTAGSDPNSATGLHHCGLVEAVDAVHVYTIEGNWNDRLARPSPTRKLADENIAGYARF